MQSRPIRRPDPGRRLAKAREDLAVARRTRYVTAFGDEMLSVLTLDA